MEILEIACAMKRWIGLLIGEALLKELYWVDFGWFGSATMERQVGSTTNSLLCAGSKNPQPRRLLRVRGNDSHYCRRMVVNN